jgi:hypothetical protein
MVIPEFSLHGFDDIVDLSHELHSTPPCTPITQPRPLRGFSAVHYPSTVGRSFSVPPSEARSSPHSRVSHHTNSQPQIAGTRSLPLFSLLTQDPGPPDSQAVLPITPSEGWHPSGDLDNLPFLDLHYYSGVGTSGNQGSGDGAADAKASRQGQALDLAQSRYSHRSAASPLPPTCNQQVPQSRSTSTAGRPHSFHHRGQSVVSPQDLLLRKGNDNKRKRASWNGGAF